MKNPISIHSLGGGKAAKEVNAALARFSFRDQGEDDVLEVTLKAWIRRGRKRGRKQVNWGVRTNVSSGRRELSLAQGKAERKA